MLLRLDLYLGIHRRESDRHDLLDGGSELTCFQLVLESFPHLWVMHRLVELSLQDCLAGVALAIDKLDGRATPNIEIILDRFRNQKHRCGL